MLKKGFLRAVSDYVSDKTFYNAAAKEKAIKCFRLTDVLKDGDDQNKIPGLLSEWLVFDYKQDIFEGMTGLEYFVKRNPLQFSNFEILEYKSLLSFEVGLFEVKSIEIGSGILIISIISGLEYFVNDISSSLSLKLENTIWARISNINRKYYLVSSAVFVLPLKIHSGMKEVILSCGKNYIDAREIASFLSSSDNNTGMFGGNASINRNSLLTYKDAEERFIKALKNARMDMMFSVRTFKKWITDEKRYGLSFTANAVICLTPTHIDDIDAKELFSASMEFANAIPRKILGGKTPIEASLERGRDKSNVLDVDVYSKDKYLKKLNEAQDLMSKVEFEKAYKLFEEFICDLLIDRVPFHDVFRIFANAGVCCEEFDPGLTEEFIEASIRINPLYDFGIRTKERFYLNYKDSSNFRKGHIGFTRDLLAVVKNIGISKYKRSVFYKYENFLKKIGVSLEYETISKQTSYLIGKDGEKSRKINRNEPCYCGSGKKFKKCCGT